MRLRKLYRRFPDAAKELELVYLACPGYILSSSKELELVYLACPGYILSSSIAEMRGRFL